MKFEFFLISALIVLLGTGGASAEDTILRVSVQVSTNSPLGKNVVAYKHAVETASKGSLKIDIYDKAQLFRDNEVIGAVRSGAVEMGIAQLGQFASEVPAVELFQQPFAFDSDALTRAAARPGSEIRRYIDAQILERTGAHVLWWQPYGAILIMSRSGPISDPSAMTGRSIRAYDSVSAEFVSRCGASPRVISSSNMLEALKTQSVDAVLTSISSIPERELWRETKFITRIRHSVFVVAGIINEKVWNRLSKSHRDLMSAAVLQEENGFWDRFAAEEADAYQFAAEKGMEVREITSDDLIKWRICSSGVLERFAEKMGEDGVRLFSAYGSLKAAQ
jgi:C4-dicarboxylate-binding protein DctP